MQLSSTVDLGTTGDNGGGGAASKAYNAVGRLSAAAAAMPSLDHDSGGMGGGVGDYTGLDGGVDSGSGERAGGVGEQQEARLSSLFVDAALGSMTVLYEPQWCKKMIDFTSTAGCSVREEGARRSLRHQRPRDSDVETATVDSASNFDGHDGRRVSAASSAGGIGMNNEPDDATATAAAKCSLLPCPMLS